jgi:hypothetical protein
MQSKGFLHSDLGFDNIGVVKTNKKYIKIFGKNVPTFGYLLKAIDFGSVLHKSFIMNKKDKQTYKNYFGHEIGTVSRMVRNNKVFGYIFNQKKINIDKKFNQITNWFKKSKENELLKQFSSDFKQRLFMYYDLYPEKFQKQFFGEKWKTIYPVFNVSMVDYFYFCKNIDNVKKIIENFSSKIIK